MDSNRSELDYYAINIALLLDHGISDVKPEYQPKTSINGNVITVTFPSGKVITLTAQEGN